MPAIVKAIRATATQAVFDFDNKAPADAAAARITAQARMALKKDAMNDRSRVAPMMPASNRPCPLGHFLPTGFSTS